MIHRFFRALLVGIARLHPSNQTSARQAYPQLWHTWPWRRKTLRRRLIMRSCGMLTGHEMSETELGYGGGPHVDINCRWCDEAMRVPFSEVDPKGPLKDLIHSWRKDELQAGEPE